MTPEQRNQRQNVVLALLCLALAPEALGASSNTDIKVNAVAAIVYILSSIVADQALEGNELRRVSKHFLRFHAAAPLINLALAAFTCLTEPTLKGCTQLSKT